MPRRDDLLLIRGLLFALLMVVPFWLLVVWAVWR